MPDSYRHQKSSGYSLEAYNNYIGYERRAKYFDVFCIQGIYERAIAEAAKKRFSGHPGSEEALQVFWAGYCDALVCFLSFSCTLTYRFLADSRC